jgi:hypothetical protein
MKGIVAFLTGTEASESIESQLKRFNTGVLLLMKMTIVPEKLPGLISSSLVCLVSSLRHKNNTKLSRFWPQQCVFQ